MTVPFQLKLVDEEMWSEFEARGNEMIVTKNGRCMFPLLKVELAQSSSEFQNLTVGFSVKIERCDEYRWKYRNGIWKKCGIDKDELNYVTDHHFEPDDSPNRLQYWCENGISFSKIKLTNRLDTSRLPPPSNYFFLCSFRRYRPIIQCKIYGQEVGMNDRKFSLILPHTEFVAVTHYQNERVTELKKSYNPHAKGFLSQSSSPIRYSPEHMDNQTDIDAYEMSASWILGNMKST